MKNETGLALLTKLSSDLEQSTGPLVNFGEMARQLHTSRQTLNSWVTKWPDFPIHQRGSNGIPYAFDVAAVFEFMANKREEQRSSRAVRDQALAQLVFPFDLGDGVDRKSGITVRDEIEAVRLKRLMREEALACGLLVDAAEMADAIGIVFREFDRALRAAIRQAGAVSQSSQAVTKIFDDHVIEAQRSVVHRARDLLKARPQRPGDGTAAASDPSQVHDPVFQLVG